MQKREKRELCGSLQKLCRLIECGGWRVKNEDRENSISVLSGKKVVHSKRVENRGNAVESSIHYDRGKAIFLEGRGHFRNNRSEGLIIVTVLFM